VFLDLMFLLTKNQTSRLLADKSVVKPKFANKVISLFEWVFQAGLSD